MLTQSNCLVPIGTLPTDRPQQLWDFFISQIPEMIHILSFLESLSQTSSILGLQTIVDRIRVVEIPLFMIHMSSIRRFHVNSNHEMNQNGGCPPLHHCDDDEIEKNLLMDDCMMVDGISRSLMSADAVQSRQISPSQFNVVAFGMKHIRDSDIIESLIPGKSVPGN